MTPKQAQPTGAGEALEIIREINDDNNIVELRAETKLLRNLVADHDFTHPDGTSSNEHVQLTLLDYYWINPGQAHTECEAAGTPLLPGTLYLDPHDDQD